jgi:hypothetical protein
MGLFNSRRPQAQRPVSEPTNELPTIPVDLTKRYDVYCFEVNHDRLYENVQFVSFRTLKDMFQGFLEIETADGVRSLIPTFHIRLICEHGAPPAFKVLRRRRNLPDD